MSDMVLIGGVLVTCIIVVMLAGITLRLQHKWIERLQAQQTAWEKAQEVQQQNWEERQDRHFSTLEKALVKRMEDTAELERKRLQQEQAHIKNELRHVPRIEDTPLPLPASHGRATTLSNSYQPRNFQGMDLSYADLTYRCLRHADLRNTNLSHANLFMADLTGASLRGADLSEADLSATNLSAADLTGATLTHANMLVTDLNNTILTGANLLHARHLTTEQVRSAVIDETTQLDESIAITHPRHPRIPLL